ncbi:MAG: tetraacyldisaccharide 4'-kinase [Gammaproteobacteria bacterium]|nr:tetraacyldisaccharide 4'-kinase [Gammaproteobacteria bacterium]
MKRSYPAFWSHRGGFSLLLWPISILYFAVIVCRRWFYRWGILSRHKIDVPVIVVGNITVGGTGKTPLVIWLVRQLQACGWQPGVVTRGYGGEASTWPQIVTSESAANMVGDEAVLLAQATEVPVVADRQRVRGCQALIKQGVDIIISDDGLQHYALQRDIEWAVIDGDRLFGNKQFLPAGPLRESLDRLQLCNAVFVQGVSESIDLDATKLPSTYRMSINNSEAKKLHSNETRALVDFKTTPVHAVAGIGHPQRFFAALKTHGISVIEHAFPDHAKFDANDFHFNDEFPVLITEKDAVKLTAINNDRIWVVNAELEVTDGAALMSALKEKLGKRDVEIDNTLGDQSDVQ